MMKSLTLLSILLIASTVHSKTEGSEQDFIQLGSFKSEARIQGRSSRAFDENDYYVSVNPATWSNAVADCKHVFGVDSTVVAIESIEEWDFLKHNLENYGGTTYWTSGLYDPSTNAWRWAANNQPLPPFAPWGNGFPTNPHGLLRVLLYFTNRFDASWPTIANTQTHRYICEIQKNLAVPCYTSNDLVVVLDSSGSIGAANYEKAKDFVNELVRAFTINKSSRIALITYSSVASTIIDIQNTLTATEISSTILSINFTGGGTATHLGIDAAIAQFNSSPRQVPLIMVVLTDGASSSLAMTSSSAAKATNLGVRSYSVGITPSINRAELLVIAGGNNNRIFTTDNFDELIKLLVPLSQDICPNVATSSTFSEIPINSIYEIPDYGVTEIPDYGVTEIPDYGVSEILDYGVTETPTYNVAEIPAYNVTKETLPNSKIL